MFFKLSEWMMTKSRKRWESFYNRGVHPILGLCESQLHGFPPRQNTVMVPPHPINHTPPEPRFLVVFFMFNWGYKFQGYLLTLSYLIPSLVLIILCIFLLITQIWPIWILQCSQFYLNWHSIGAYLCLIPTTLSHRQWVECFNPGWFLSRLLGGPDFFWSGRAINTQYLGVQFRYPAW